MSKVRANQLSNREGTGAPTMVAGVVVTGIATATTFDGNLTGNVTGTATTATNAVNAESGSALETSINSKTSPGKAIALSMVFG
tara:strand:+ start:522 stop:773 length:252 start_codon:yes stop_codon:yes gene_type:complete